jgi:hypothetical protein
MHDPRGEHYKMVHGINAAIAATVPICAKRVSPAIYFMAVRCQSYEEAYSKWLRKIEHLLPIPLVKPWERMERNQKKVLATTSQYTQGNTAPADYDHRATEASRSVAEFSEGTHKPERDGMRGKISPKEKRSRRIPAEHVCKGCGRDVRRAWAVINGNLTQITDHSECMNQSVVLGGLAPKAGMSRRKKQKQIK